jgi:hypothetical protein
MAPEVSDRADVSTTTRRSLFITALGAVLCVAAGYTEAQARPWGDPPGWSRGRKNGWRKKGGPKGRW